MLASPTVPIVHAVVLHFGRGLTLGSVRELWGRRFDRLRVVRFGRFASGARAVQACCVVVGAVIGGTGLVQGDEIGVGFVAFGLAVSIVPPAVLQVPLRLWRFEFSASFVRIVRRGRVVFSGPTEGVVFVVPVGREKLAPLRVRDGEVDVACPFCHNDHTSVRGLTDFIAVLDELGLRHEVDVRTRDIV